MINKNISVIVVLIILIEMISLLNVPSISYGQQLSPTGRNNIPSDLNLDLTFAQKNPAPDRQTIVDSEIKQVVATTTTGITTTVKSEDILAPGVKTEQANEAIHPEQTTSEQVVSIPVSVEVPVNQNQDSTNGGNQPTGIQSQNGNINNGTINQTGTDNNFVPGTIVSQPDDNAAPMDNSSNPNLPGPTTANSPENSTQNNQQPINQSGSTDTSQPNYQQSNPPTDNSAPQSNPPTDNSAPQSNPPADNSTPQSNPPTDNSAPQSNPPADNSAPQSNPPADNSAPQSNPPADNPPAVQGAKIGPMQSLWNNIVHILTGK